MKLEAVRRGHEHLAALLELGEEAAHAFVPAEDPAFVIDELDLRVKQWDGRIDTLLAIGTPQLAHRLEALVHRGAPTRARPGCSRGSPHDLRLPWYSRKSMPGR